MTDLMTSLDENGQSSDRLTVLTMQLLGITRELSSLHATGDNVFLISDSAKFAEETLVFLRARRDALPEFHNSESAWHMLVELYIARKRGQRLAVSDVGRDTGVPLTTSLRNLDRLVAAGMVVREPDPRDARRHHVSISREGEQKLDELFGRAQHRFAAIGPGPGYAALGHARDALGRQH